jgi:hypothetical protein
MGGILATAFKIVAKGFNNAFAEGPLFFYRKALV